MRFHVWKNTFGNTKQGHTKKPNVWKKFDVHIWKHQIPHTHKLSIYHVWKNRPAAQKTTNPVWKHDQNHTKTTDPVWK